MEEDIRIEFSEDKYLITAILILSLVILSLIYLGVKYVEKYEIKKKSVGGVALRRFPFFLLLSFALLSLCCC